jgi:hypothetical protein
MKIEAGRFVFCGTTHLILFLMSSVCFVGCDSASTHPASASADPGSLAAPAFEWPVDPDTGHVRQATKKPTDHDLQPSLVLMHNLPDGQMPDQDITPLNVRRVSTQELEEIFQAGDWALVDVRKDADIKSKGTIPGAYHAEYKFEAARYTGGTQLTPRVVQQLLEQYEGIVFFCNGPKCPRSFNACVGAVQHWRVPGNRIRWYRKGVPGWRQTTLIPTPREAMTRTTQKQPPHDAHR